MDHKLYFCILMDAGVCGCARIDTCIFLKGIGLFKVLDESLVVVSLWARGPLFFFKDTRILYIL